LDSKVLDDRTVRLYKLAATLSGDDSSGVRLRKLRNARGYTKEVLGGGIACWVKAQKAWGGLYTVGVSVIDIQAVLSLEGLRKLARVPRGSLRLIRHTYGGRKLGASATRTAALSGKGVKSFCIRYEVS
jgi:hypothetical protein